MDRRNDFIGLAGDNREGANPVAFRVLPILPQSGKSKWLTGFEHDAHRNFAVGRLFPFVEAIRQNETAPLFERIAVSGLLFQALDAGVDHLVTSRGVFGPMRDKAPAQ